MILKKCSLVITGNPSMPYLRDVDICIEDNVITEISGKVSCRGEETVDCSGKIVMPGFVDCHTFTEDVFLLNLVDGVDGEDVEEAIRRIKDGIGVAESKMYSKIVAMAAAMSGVVKVIGACFKPFEAIKAFKDIGIGLLAGLAVFTSDELQAAVNTVRNSFREGKERLYELSLALMSLCDDADWDIVKALLDEDIKVQIRPAAYRREALLFRRKHGVFPVQYLARRNLLSGNTILTRIGWVTSWELGLIAEAGCSCVFCPIAEFTRATGGFSPVKELQKLNVNVGIGSGGAAWSGLLSFFDVLRGGLWALRSGYSSVDIRSAKIFRMATSEGKAISGGVASRIAEGEYADLVILGGVTAALCLSMGISPESGIVMHCSWGDVEATIVDGRIVYEKTLSRSWLEKINKLALKLKSLEGVLTEK